MHLEDPYSVVGYLNSSDTDTSCPSPLDRKSYMANWTCDEYDDFQNVLLYRKVINYSACGLQVVIFTWLFFALICSSGKASKMSILLAIFSLLNGALGIIQINSMNSILEVESVNHDFRKVSICINQICMLGAIWFYSIRYYETATDLEQIMVKQSLIS